MLTESFDPDSDLHVVQNEPPALDAGVVVAFPTAKSNPAPINSKNWEHCWSIHRRMVREWFNNLTSMERLAILFVFDRTLGWGKEWERITLSHCVDGVWSEDGKTCYAAGFSSHRDRAAASLASLIKRGYVKCRSAKKSTDRAKEYSLNTSMKMPKRLQKQPDENGPKHGPGTGVMDGPFSGVMDGPGTGASNSSPRKDKSASQNLRAATLRAASPPDPERAEIERVAVESKARSTDRRDARLSGNAKLRALRKNGTGHLPSRPALADIWLDLLGQYFPDAKRLTIPVVTLKILSDYGKKWTLSREEGEFREYLEWLFANWLRLRAGALSWMDAAPPVPVIALLVSSVLRGIFERAYNERLQWEEWGKLDAVDREVALLLDRGFDREVAERMAQDRFGLDRQRKEIDLMRERVGLLRRDLAQQRLAFASRVAQAASKASGGGSAALAALGEFKWDEGPEQG